MCLELSNKMNLTIRMTILNSITHRHTNCLKFGDRYYTSPMILELKANASICSKIKRNLHCENEMM